MKIRLLMVLLMVTSESDEKAPIKKEETAEYLLKSELAEVKSVVPRVVKTSPTVSLM